MKFVKLILCFFMIVSIVACSKNKNEKKDDSNSIVETENNQKITIEDLFINGIDNYLGKKITVVGYSPWQPVGTLAEISSEDWEYSIYVTNIDEPFGGGYEVTVTGEIGSIDGLYIINCETYSIDENIVRGESDSNENNDYEDKSDYEYFIESCENVEFINWNQFYNNPVSLAGTVLFVPGTVKEVEYIDGETRGWIDTKGRGDFHDYVYFIIDHEVYNFNRGNRICPLGEVAPYTINISNSNMNRDIPVILVYNDFWGTKYNLSMIPIELLDYVSGNYINGDYEIEIARNEVKFNDLHPISFSWDDAYDVYVSYNEYSKAGENGWKFGATFNDDEGKEYRLTYYFKSKKLWNNDNIYDKTVIFG